MEQRAAQEHYKGRKSLGDMADTANHESLRQSREVSIVTTPVQNILTPSSTSHLITNLFPTLTDHQTPLSWSLSTTYPMPIYPSLEGVGFNYNSSSGNINSNHHIKNDEPESLKRSSVRKSASQGFQSSSSSTARPTSGLNFDGDSNTKTLSFTGDFMDRYNNHSASVNVPVLTSSKLHGSAIASSNTSPAMKTISGPVSTNAAAGNSATRSYSSVLHSQAPVHTPCSSQSVSTAPPPTNTQQVQHNVIHQYQPQDLATNAAQNLNSSSVFNIKQGLFSQGTQRQQPTQQQPRQVNDFLSPLGLRSYNQHLIQNYSSQNAAAHLQNVATPGMSGVSGNSATGGGPFRRNYFPGSNFPEKPNTAFQGNGGGGPKRRNKLPSIGAGNVPGDIQRRLDNSGTENNERYSRKVFVGGLPPDIDEEEIKASFRRFGSLVVDWPHKAESKSYFPPKGYAFLLFQEEASVQALIEASLQENDKLYLCVSSPTIRDKPVQIRPWRLSDADFVLDSTLALDPRKTVFVGGVPRPLKASELANIMNNLYGNVCYAGIDTDPELKYPKGAGRVAFSNHQSYIAAISARFVHLQHCEIEKRVEVKPYVLDDQVCDECRGSRCGNKFAPFFCANITCLQYYCENCWTSVHSQLGKEFHKPLVKEGADRPRGSQFKWC